jgi:hypothetical protein
VAQTPVHRGPHQGKTAVVVAQCGAVQYCSAPYVGRRVSSVHVRERHTCGVVWCVQRCAACTLLFPARVCIRASVPREEQLGNLQEIVCVTAACANVVCQVDKRNHELGLWLLDSLPKATMKEVLQSVCREVSKSMLSYFRCFSPAPHTVTPFDVCPTYLFV